MLQKWRCGGSVLTLYPPRIALLAYDYLLTFRHEVRFVWGKKFSAATVLFVLNRYFIILLYVVDMVTQFPIIAEVSP